MSTKQATDRDKGEMKKKKKTPFHQKVMTMAAFRDIAHGTILQTDNRSLSDRHCQEYSTFRFGSNMDQEDVKASGNIEIWDSPHCHTFMQALQYANYLKPFPGDGDSSHDTRVWDVFSSHVFSPNQITVPFMKLESRHTGSSKKGKKEDASLEMWKWAQSTPLERVVFLMFLIHVSEEVPRIRNGTVLGKRKRFPYFTKTRLNSQKLAFALQRVIRAWDRVAHSFGFISTEKMLIPYMVPSPKFDSFCALRRREDGYAPVDLERTFSDRLSPTTSDQLVTPRALGYTDDVDEGFRRLARHFLSDLQLVAADEEFYKDDMRNWRHGGTFPKEGPLKRFQSMAGALQGLQEALGVEEELEFLLPDSQPRFVDPSEHSAMDTISGTSPVDNGVCGEACDCWKARSVIKSVMESYCRLHNTTFQNLADADSTLRPEYSESIIGNAQLVLTHPPCTTSPTGAPKGANYDTIHETDMEEVVDVIYELLRPGGHAIIFCSQAQVPILTKPFTASTSTDEDEANEANFEVDDNTFIFAYKPGLFTSSNRPGNFHHGKNSKAVGIRNVTMQAVHVMKLGCSKKEAAKMVRLKHFGHVDSWHQGTANLLDNIPKHQPDERLYFVDEDGIGRRMILDNQICVALLKELICRFSHPGDVIVDLFSGSCSTGVASCTIDNEAMRVFVGSEIDEKMFIPYERRMVEAFASALADDAKRSVVFPVKKFTEDVIRDAKLVVSHSTNLSSARNIWARPQGLPELSILPKYITRHVMMVLKEFRRQNLVCGKPFHEWPRDIRSMMESIDFENLLALECLEFGLYIGRSKINHEQAGFGLFANRTFSQGDYFAPYYGRLVFDDLSNRSDRGNLYGDGFTACNGNEFLNYSMALKVSRDAEFAELLPRERIEHKDKKFREVFVVPFLFTVAARINDPRNVAGEIDYVLSKEPRGRVQRPVCPANPISEVQESKPTCSNRCFGSRSD